MGNGQKILLLSIGYGRGHHSAAQALAEEMQRRGWRTEILDACAEACPSLFKFTRAFYRTCVRRLPWLWGLVYAQIDSANWARLLSLPGIYRSMQHLREKLQNDPQQLVVCTYPLYAYMLDAFSREGWFHTPYAVVVTAALNVNSAWAQSQAPLICLPESSSKALLAQRFAIPPSRLVASGFPVRSAFSPVSHLPTPGTNGEGLHIMYGAHAPLSRVRDDLLALVNTYPCCHITVLAEEREPRLRRLLEPVVSKSGTSSIEFYGKNGADPAIPLRSAHLYIGKAGASTVFEAYSTLTPALINYVLPGQEEGNLRLLLQDGAGMLVNSTEELLSILNRLLAHNAAGLARMRRATKLASRSGGAGDTAKALLSHFFPSLSL